MQVFAPGACRAFQSPCRAALHILSRPVACCHYGTILQFAPLIIHGLANCNKQLVYDGCCMGSLGAGTYIETQLPIAMACQRHVISLAISRVRWLSLHHRDGRALLTNVSSSF